MIKNIKIRAFVVAFAIISSSVVMPTSRAAFPVEKNKTETTKHLGPAASSKSTGAITSDAKEITSKKNN